MKSKLKKLTFAAGLLIVALGVFIFFAYADALAIRRDLHLGLSPCRVALPASKWQTVRVAVAAISDTTKEALKARYSWHQVTSGNWDADIPWFEDLVVSTEFDPVLRHAPHGRHTSNDGKLKARYVTPQWRYDLTLDDNNNILWIVRDTPSAPSYP